tara:strand:- start:288 stop:416 length:129 start_codon:yes stop_codon:yes gene_type:complete
MTMRRIGKAPTLEVMVRTLGLIPKPLEAEEANLGAIPNALER